MKQKTIAIIIFLISIMILTTSYAVGEQETEIIKISTIEEKVLILINEKRQEKGLNELKIDKDLYELATIKGEDLVENNYFDHKSEKLGRAFDMMKAWNIEYKIAGENLAGNISPEKAVEAWLNSETHRDNILKEEYDYTGIAVIPSEKYGYIFVQMFIYK